MPKIPKEPKFSNKKLTIEVGVTQEMKPDDFIEFVRDLADQPFDDSNLMREKIAKALICQLSDADAAARIVACVNEACGTDYAEPKE